MFGGNYFGGAYFGGITQYYEVLSIGLQKPRMDVSRTTAVSLDAYPIKYDSGRKYDSGIKYDRWVSDTDNLSQGERPRMQVEKKNAIAQVA